MDLHQLVPIVDPKVQEWALLARLLRWLTFLWLLIGLAVLFSASYPSANADFGDGLYYFKRQLVWVVVGLIGFNILVYSPLRYIQNQAHWLFLLLLGGIWLTFIPGLGTTVNGATRWLSIGSLPIIQPSELIKPFLVLQSARIFGQWYRLSWQVRLSWLVIFGAVLLGILLQPNLSTTALCGMTLWLVAFAAGLPYPHLGSAALGGVLLAVTSISIKEYQRRRLMSFFNPWVDPFGDGYQLIQSLLAIGSGGIWGTGFGFSQQKLLYLPIQYTDFIFAVFAEEFGFAGSLALLLLLIAYTTVAFLVAYLAQNPVHRLIAIGATVLMVGQSFLNIGVASGVLPTTGLPLPLFSYGGSSMIASLAIAGLLIRVARESSGATIVSLQGRDRPKKKRSVRSQNSSPPSS